MFEKKKNQVLYVRRSARQNMKTGCYYNGDSSKDHQRNGISLNGMNKSHVTRNLKGKISYAGCEIMKIENAIDDQLYGRCQQNGHF